MTPKGVLPLRPAKAAEAPGSAQAPAPPGITRWWWVRHGPVPGLKGRILGRSDVACDTSDLDALIILADRLPPGATLLVSPLLRARQTAQALENAGALLQPAEEEDDLREQDFGTWEGHAWTELMTREPPDPAVTTFWSDPAREAPPEGESFAQVMARVAHVVETWSERMDGGDVVVVGHAGPIRAAVAQALDLSPAAALRLGIDPLSLTRIDRHAGPPRGWSVQCVNETIP
ncbi:histidine phosphatase family protein [Pararhodospirillum photometricum]|uniref:Phosphoglycerate/bisphosphoglycerate mutase n=1 Tax=Pararhodospirillum photometricum DSM 122 TaxID=1150469 RepID=H6SJL2_PARPM|nr:histidine phosphatase family protein [Pararhodospirillum photometricum]CCG08177.1 Phosphoglycerate/bisphosphoglycerate mutase [Pararhodospirillum photometricum DSM 122]